MYIDRLQLMFSPLTLGLVGSGGCAWWCSDLSRTSPTLNLEPETSKRLYSKLQTRNLEPLGHFSRLGPHLRGASAQTLNPKRSTQNLELQHLNPKPKTPKPKL